MQTGPCFPLRIRGEVTASIDDGTPARLPRLRERKRSVALPFALSPCTLQGVHEACCVVDWMDGPTCREQPILPCAASTWGGHVPRRGGRDGRPVGGLRRERQYRDRRASRWPEVEGEGP